VDGDGWEGLY